MLVDEPGVGRSHREAPEIDGVVERARATSRSGAFATVTVTGGEGPDLVAAAAVPMATSFGPSALATPGERRHDGAAAHRADPAVAMIDGAEASWPAVRRSGSLLSVTDGVDGYLARRHGTTRSGAFLDPLADKVLVLGAMFALVAAATCSGGCRWCSSPCARSRSAVPQLSAAQRASRSRRARRQGEDGRAGGRGRLRAAAARRGRAAGSADTFLWVAVVLTLVHRRAVPARLAARHAQARVSVRCEVVAVGTELLLGQIVDTNSSWIGEQLALAGIDSPLPDEGRATTSTASSRCCGSRSTAATR